MIDLTEMAAPLSTALADRVVCMVGTASSGGEPNISFKGSMMVWDKDHLAFWERSKKDTLAHLEENPQIVVFYRNPQAQQAWRLYGTAEVMREGPLRDEIMSRTVQAELDRDPDRAGAGILIAVQRVTNGRGDVLQQREG
jgi:general stress protein 26